ACRRYCSDAGIQLLRHRDVVFRVELAAPHEHALALAEIDFRAVELLQPGVAVALREPEEQALDLDALAVDEKRLQPLGAEGAKPLHQDVRLVERLALRHFFEQFENRALGRRERQRPIPMSPRLLHEAGICGWLGRRMSLPILRRRNRAVPEELKRTAKN